VTNNKLVELPSGISSLRCLESLDLSNNRLTSLGSVKLVSMLTLQYLNLQVYFYQKLPPSVCNYSYVFIVDIIYTVFDSVGSDL
jgi:hypothetical protein